LLAIATFLLPIAMLALGYWIATATTPCIEPDSSDDWDAPKVVDYLMIVSPFVAAGLGSLAIVFAGHRWWRYPVALLVGGCLFAAFGFAMLVLYFAAAECGP
jgi:hypothetical protein